ncbi:Asp-tRNA(Asn)/Glu-tRNA(Gln) amidotransferase A subunit family amidase [Bradyrhizobium sp. GM7.3]
MPMHKKGVEEEVTSLHDLSAVDLIAGYRAKQFSPSEVLEDVLAHVAAWEPHLKALYAFDPDGARETAKASTARWSGGEPSGALDGVPVTVKDNIATKGVPVPLGAASVKLVPAEKDAPPAARLREAGAIIFAKTTMPDYGMLSSGLSSFHALARNPWDLSKNPGGSSAGAGAAAAGRLWSAASRHRYRRLGPPARGLVRPRRIEAELWPRADRSHLCRPSRRPHDPHR